MATKGRDQIERAVEAAAKLRLLEDEVGSKVAPFRDDRNLMHEIAKRSGMRASYLVELSDFGSGKRKRHGSPPELKKTG